MENISHWKTCNIETSGAINGSNSFVTLTSLNSGDMFDGRLEAVEDFV